MSEKGKKNKKKTGLGLAIWILLFLIILIVFLVKQEEIKENLDKSGATQLIEKKIGKEVFEKKDSQKTGESGETIIDLTKNLKKSEPIAKSEPKKSESTEKNEKQTTDSLKENSDSSTKNAKSEEKKTEVTLKPTEKSENQKTQTTAQQNQSQQSQNQKTSDKGQGKSKKEDGGNSASRTVESQNTQNATPATQFQTSQTAIAQKTESAPAPVSNTIKAKICFVAIDSDGPVVRKEVTRSVAKDSPMGDALKMLLSGPSTNEAKTGCRSLIPAGSRLLSATVKNGVAILNFSEEFQFNQFGAEGSIAQLMQVVYTATNFSTVKSVQILIEGQKRDYLTEGVWVGSPLSRSSF